MGAHFGSGGLNIMQVFYLFSLKTSKILFLFVSDSQIFFKYFENLVAKKIFENFFAGVSIQFLK